MLNDDKVLKKLLLIYWEIVPKTNAEGKLLSELILVCDAYRKVGFLVFPCSTSIRTDSSSLTRTCNTPTSLCAAPLCAFCAS